MQSIITLLEKRRVVTGECWEWPGHRMKNGYGRISLDGKLYLAHRIAYEAYKGPIKDGLCVCHTCDNPACFNPKHLWLGTRVDNNWDCAAKGRCNKQGENNGRSKLTSIDVAVIRKSTKTLREIADEYNISWSTAQRAKSGTSWQNVK